MTNKTLIYDPKAGKLGKFIYGPDMFYYSKGVTDPDYCVLRFTAKKGRYYYNLETQDFEV